MEHENYEVNLESWASSLMEFDDEETIRHDTYQKPTYHAYQSALISLEPSYYRSKAFSNNTSINNLINASDPLLTLATKLRQISVPPDIATLHQNLCHEIKAFENKAQTLDYRSSIIMAARFVVCSLLDELIALTIWPDTEWKEFSLIQTFHKEPWDGNRFFLILERSLQDPAAHLDLLELIYICLKLGYEGKYRQLERGHFELRNLTDHVYQVILSYREESPRSLLISLENPNLYMVRKKTYLHLLPPVWFISTVMITILIFMFTFFYFKLIESATPVQKFINTLKPIQETVDIRPATYTYLDKVKIT